eukprot:3435041-Lingulodinium_polyedra.AAC.1
MPRCRRSSTWCTHEHQPACVARAASPASLPARASPRPGRPGPTFNVVGGERGAGLARSRLMAGLGAAAGSVA